MKNETAKIIKDQQAKLRAGMADHFYENSAPGPKPEPPTGLVAVLADINRRFANAGARFQRLEGSAQ